MLELNNRRCDMVLTGGVDALNDIFMYMCFSKTQALSASGDAKPFAKDADGTVLGQGFRYVVGAETKIYLLQVLRIGP